ncbi:hypothetical protein TWF481_010019 [Arthrobotrys musiformis]|uniref:HMG box domain-containing protein n=1 Tax=Arthrobotrys musiformis TaxID=47236 RepID=A0AAV9W1M4_9PEZI
MLAVGRSRLAASSGLSLPKLSAIVARAIARSGPLSSGAANAISSQATFAPFVKANLPLLTNLVLREYATAAKKAAPKKKAPAKKKSTTTAKKPAVKRRAVAKKSGTRRTATKKKTVAKKKKAAPKKKKVVRKKKAVAKKPGIQIQYNKSLGDAPTKKANAYNLFFIDVVKTLEGVSTAPQKAKEIAQKWNALSDAEKQKWTDRASEETVKRKAAYAQWLAKQNPLDIEAANNARNRIRAHRAKKGIKSGSTPVSKIKDDRLVKRPCTAWIFFMKDKYHTAEIDGIEHKLKLTKLAQLWRGASASEKKKYEDLATKDAARYKAERAEFLKKYSH